MKSLDNADPYEPARAGRLRHIRTAEAAWVVSLTSILNPSLRSFWVEGHPYAELRLLGSGIC